MSIAYKIVTMDNEKKEELRILIEFYEEIEEKIQNKVEYLDSSINNDEYDNFALKRIEELEKIQNTQIKKIYCRFPFLKDVCVYEIKKMLECKIPLAKDGGREQHKRYNRRT